MGTQKPINEISLTEYGRNHRMCMHLALSYLVKILEQEAERTNENLVEQLRKYQPAAVEGSGFFGKTWIMWFLKDLVPNKLEEEYVSER